MSKDTIKVKVRFKQINIKDQAAFSFRTLKLFKLKYFFRYICIIDFRLSVCKEKSRERKV